MQRIMMAWMVVLLSAGLAMADGAEFESFESGKGPAGWSSTASEFVGSTDRFKDGAQSLLWSWSSPEATLTYRNPDGFGKIIRPEGRRPGSALGFWLYSEGDLRGVADIEFLRDEEVIGTCWISVDFSGWRPIGIPYHVVLEQPTLAVNCIRIHAPADSGRLYVDYFNPNIAANVPHSHQVPWLSLDEVPEDPSESMLSAGDISQNRPWLPERKDTEDLSEAALADMTQLADHWLPETPGPGEGAEEQTMDELRGQIAEWNILRDGDSVTGRAVDHASFIKPPDAAQLEEYMSFCERVKNAYSRAQGENRRELAEMFVTLTLHLLDQGYDCGSGLVSKPTGYVYRHWPPIFYRMREVLSEAGILREVALALLYQMGGSEEALSEEPEANMDRLHLVNKALLPCASMIPDLAEREQWLRAIQRYYSVVLLNRDTLGPDGCAYHHWFHHFSYASYSMPFPIRAAHSLDDTLFEIGAEAHERLRRYVYAMTFAMVNHTQPWNMNGRSGTPISRDMSDQAGLLAEMGTPDGEGEIDPLMAGLYLKITDTPDEEPATTWSAQGIEPLDLTGHLTLNGTAAALHRRDDWLVSIVGMVKFWRGLEIYGWHQSNNYGMYARNGSICVAAGGDPVTIEDSGYQEEGWNWCHFPGTTCLKQPVHEMFRGYAMFGNPSPIAGGTTLGEDGVWGLDFAREEVNFRQSAFCSGDLITVIKTGIKSDADRPVVTTLFQNALGEQMEPTLVDGEMIGEYPRETELAADEPCMLMDTIGTGYYVHQGHDPISLARHEQTWTYMFDRYLKDPDDNPVIDYLKREYRHDDMRKNHEYFEPTRALFELAYFAHGTKPDGARCVYTIMPSTGPDELEAFAAEMGTGTPPVQVLMGGAYTHIVRDNASRTTGYVLFRAHDTIQFGRHLRGVDRPCFAMVRENEASLDISIASSDIENKKPIVIRIHDRWHIADASGIKGEPELKWEGFDTIISLPYDYYMPMTLHLEPIR